MLGSMQNPSTQAIAAKFAILSPLLDERALVALALLIAESDPKHKDIIVKLIIGLMQDQQ